MTRFPFTQHNDVLTGGKGRKAEEARHRWQGKEVETVPSTTKNPPEEASKPPNNTTIKTARKEGIKDGAPKPPERSTTEPSEGAGSKPRDSTAATAVPTRTIYGPSSTTRGSPPNPGDATGPGSSVDAKQPQTLARNPSRKVSRKLSVQDTRQEGSGGVPTRDVRIPLSSPQVPPRSIGGNGNPNHKVTQSRGDGTTDGSPSRPPLSADRMYPIFSRFVALKPIDWQTATRLRTVLQQGM